LIRKFFHPFSVQRHTKPVDVLYFPTPNNGSLSVSIGLTPTVIVSCGVTPPVVENDDRDKVACGCCTCGSCDGIFNTKHGVDEYTAWKFKFLVLFNEVRRIDALLRHRFVTIQLLMVLHFHNCCIMMFVVVVVVSPRCIF
jgi:hypothetical protein